MQRALSIALGLGVIVLAFWLTSQQLAKWHPERPVDAGDVDATTDAATEGGPIVDLSFDAGAPDPLQLDFPIFSGETRRSDGGVGSKMPDGSPVPPLPDDAPKQVHFGVILITYRGAEGASATARSKADATELAKQLGELAKTDFHAAVRRGDDGSGDDLGRMPRGVLELAPEYFLFTLGKGKVSDPIDTPRGYWIVRRID
jgi:hypothetical protein